MVWLYRLAYPSGEEARNFLVQIISLFLYSALLHLPPLRFRCADGCWDRTQYRRMLGLNPGPTDAGIEPKPEAGIEPRTELGSNPGPCWDRTQDRLGSNPGPTGIEPRTAGIEPRNVKLFLPAFAPRRGAGGEGLGTFTAEFNLFKLIILLASGLSELPVRPLRRSASANTNGRRGESPLRFSSHLFNQNVARLHSSTTGEICPLASSGGSHIYLSRDGILGNLTYLLLVE
jgi:hypothetical protein